MQKNKQKSKVFLTIVSFALAAVLFFAAWISAAEKDKQKSELKGENENPIKEEIKEEIKKEKVVKPPRNFVPTEKVTADQAVAFPSDI
jgi:nitrate reductase cytochrome c-type subunit|tara:strand:+ start:446 stop:709 length:264 start_codon:yes stop_codon:yes gene_type:complete